MKIKRVFPTSTVLRGAQHFNVFPIFRVMCRSNQLCVQKVGRWRAECSSKKRVKYMPCTCMLALSMQRINATTRSNAAIHRRSTHRNTSDHQSARVPSPSTKGCFVVACVVHQGQWNALPATASGRSNLVVVVVVTSTCPRHHRHEINVPQSLTHSLTHSPLCRVRVVGE